MIKVDKNETIIDFHGGIPEFATEVTMLLRAVRKTLTETVGQETADDLINQSVRLSRMNEQELEKEAARVQAEFFCSRLWK